MTTTKARSSRRAASRALAKASLSCAAALSAAAGIGVLSGTQARAGHIEYEIATVGDPFMKSTSGARDFRTPITMNAVGQVVATQDAYDQDGDPTGRISWFFDPADESQVQIGLFDAHHTGTIGGDTHQSNTIAVVPLGVGVAQFNDLGFVAGTAQQYLPPPAGQQDSVLGGVSTWVYDHNSTAADKTTRVGLFDNTLDSFGVSHSTHNDIQNSAIVKLNAAGTVVGNSTRYKQTGAPPNSSTQFGQSAWIQAPGDAAATRIGFTDAEHGTTGPSGGLQNSTVTHLNDQGDAAGTSQRFTSNADAGKSAWLRTAEGAIKKVGFTANDHTGAATNEYTSSVNNRRESEVVALSNRIDDTTGALAIGFSKRWEGSFQERGRAAWVQGPNDTNAVRLGFYDADHTSNNGATGTKSSTPKQITNTGYVIGSSQRFAGTTLHGETAWLYHGSQGQEQVGLTGAEFEGTVIGTRAFKNSVAQLVNESGNVAGITDRFVGTTTKTAAGQAAWVHTYMSGPSTRIGLFDGEHATDHTRSSDGRQFSTVVAMNDLGTVVGHSTRYIDGQTGDWGQSAYISDGVNNTRIGLFGASDNNEHTSSDGFHSSTVEFLNENGQAAGISLRYNNNLKDTAPGFGQSGWFFDGTTSHELAFSTSSLGKTFTEISFLSDTGIVLGHFEQFEVGSSEGVNHAFLWDFNQPAAERFHDLGLFVEGGLTAAGWETLNSVLDMSDFGHILGVGTLTNPSGGGSMPFVLTPIPEPATATLLAVTGLALLPRRRRRD